jgi:hypothetical protein
MTVYGTFDGFKNNRTTANNFKWHKVVNELGKSMSGDFISEIDPIFGMKKMNFGKRYKLECKVVDGNMIGGITEYKEVNKNPRCDVFRKFKDEFHMISGKYKGKTNKDISDYDLSMYCIWLAKNTDNEATISNTLEILKKIHDER